MMNVFRFKPAPKSVLILLTALCCLLTVSFQPSLASGDDESNEAAAAARMWVSQIDAARYEDSYNAGCFEFHQKVSQDKWTLVLKTLRFPLGAVVSRTEVSRALKENGIPGLDGECMVITYDTSFEKMMDAKEVIVLKREDGRWRGAGYTAGPKPPPDGTDQPPATEPAQTQIDTQTVTPDLPEK